ncbi:MAG: lytic transglycosylase domain-containing protein [Deltaproteobacteria bacterium]|nr:lytic transglycosylase domain-containing protein [Deltaproteobacteria bacterium]
MDSDSMLINSAGSITCGIFSIIMVLFLIGLPAYDHQEQHLAIVKGPRPYKTDITETDISKPYLNYSIKKRESLFAPIITQAADKNNVDPALIKAIIMAESAYDPTAISKKGAIGLMQLMPHTAASLSPEDMCDPVHNINAGVRYLKTLLNKFDGDLELTLAAYNAGISKVRKYNGVPPYETTRYYVKTVFEYYRYYREV